jgi:predicted DNA-binding transcriptional regulator YafY
MSKYCTAYCDMASKYAHFICDYVDKIKIATSSAWYNLYHYNLKLKAPGELNKK